MAMASSSRTCRLLGSRLLRCPLQALAMVGKQQASEGVLAAPLRPHVSTGIGGAAPSLMFVESLTSWSNTSLFANSLATAGVRRLLEQENQGVQWFSGAAGSTSKVLHASSDEEYKSFLQSALEKNQVAVVDFTATWCAPCRHMAPVVEDMSKEFDDVVFIKVDIDEAEVQKTVNAASIRAVPTFTFHKGGKKVAEFSGADASKLREIVSLLRQG